MMLEVRDVNYAYSSQKTKKVLNKANICFEENKFYAIVGPSGAGKTTILSLLAGLDTPSSGQILYQGQDIQKKGLYTHRKENIALVFQNYNLIDYLTTIENVKLGGKNNVEELLTKVNIPKEDWNRNVLHLSGGQQQRVAIARALASNANVLLADEPTGNLDEDTADEIVQVLKQSAHELGKCVIVVTHSKRLASEADEIIKISNGMVEIQ